MEGILDEYFCIEYEGVNVVGICFDIYFGIEYFYKNEVIYRDLKFQNILYKIMLLLKMKIGDLGLSKIFQMMKFFSLSDIVMYLRVGIKCWKVLEFFVNDG